MPGHPIAIEGRLVLHAFLISTFFGRSVEKKKGGMRKYASAGIEPGTSKNYRTSHLPTGLRWQLLCVGSIYRTLEGLFVYAHTCNGVDDLSALNGRTTPPAYGAADHTPRTPNSKTRNTRNTGNTRNSRKKKTGRQPPRTPPCRVDFK